MHEGITTAVPEEATRPHPIVIERTPPPDRIEFRDLSVGDHFILFPPDPSRLRESKLYRKIDPGEDTHASHPRHNSIEVKVSRLLTILTRQKVIKIIL